MSNTIIQFIQVLPAIGGQLDVFPDGNISGTPVSLLVSNTLDDNQALLDASAFGSGNVLLGGDFTYGLTFEFDGVFANSNIPPAIAFDASGLAPSASPLLSYTPAGIAAYVAPSSGSAAQFELAFSGGSYPISAGSYTIDGVNQQWNQPYPGSSTWGASTDNPSLGSVTVTANSIGSGPAEPAYDTYAMLMSPDGISFSQWDGTVTPSFTPGENPVTEVYQVDSLTFSNVTGGTFTITPDIGSTTSAIPYGASASAVELALDGAIGSYPVSVAAISGGYSITFSYNGEPSSAYSADGSELTLNVVVTETVVQAGSAGAILARVRSGF